MRLNLLLFTFLACATAWVDGAERESTWSGLPAIIADKQMIADLYAGGAVEGNVISVNSKELRMNVIRSDDARFSAKMEHGIPRPAIARLQLIERGVAGPILGAIAGAVGGFFVTGTIFDKPGQLPIPQAFAGGVAGTVGGFLLGRRMGRRVTMIRILPN